MTLERPLTAAEIYEQVTGGNGPGRLSAAAEAAGRLRQVLDDLTADVRAAAEETDRGWEGGAGSRAAVLAMPLALASETDGALLRSVDRTLTDQITAFAGARDSVVPVPPQPPVPTREDVVRDLLGGNSYRTSLDAYERAALNNVAAFRSYHQASTANSDALPARYSPLTTDGIGITRTGASGPALGDSGELQLVPVGRGPDSIELVESSDSTAGSASATSPERHSHPSNTSAGTASPSPAPSPERTDGTHAAAHTSQPTVTAPPPSPGDAQFGPSGRPGTHLPATQHAWTPAPTGTGSGPRNVPLRTGGTAPPSHGPATPPPNSPNANTPGRTPTTPPPGHPSPPGRGSGAGMVGGLGDHARGGTAPVPGTANGTAARGTTGLPMGAAARGGAEDKDRSRPDYLRNPDPEDTFSDPLPKTAPPVIGRTHQTHRGGTWRSN
ncbi:PPE domain-containing protein [Saccharomonospora cyanea]|uniref:PPE family protein n=1 Tax=Saccharomonospora cyanea NA-134 TaxID=882082 RepID=H5XEV7_9PSEU|nr:PPE domain-containing protein [Saccharomonospora cyanea]EHR59339.1 PPE family protein [Saccharomonospora cyanea NA-134]